MKNPIGGNLFSLVFASTLLIASSCKKEEGTEPVVTEGKSSAVFNPSLTYGTVSDHQGNVYKTIKIGTQTWMAENLRSTHYRNGDPIPNVKSAADWIKLSSGAYCTYGNSNNLDSIATFGNLYNWYVVSDSRKVCPFGWHVPSKAEAQTLMTFLGQNTAGTQLKEAGAKWKNNTGGTNSSGFTALPTGVRRSDTGEFSNLGGLTGWWTTTEKDANFAWFQDFGNYESSFEGANPKQLGYCIRCLQD